MKFKLLLVFLCLFVFSKVAFAQKLKISIRVYSSDSIQPIPWVGIQINHRPGSTFTDENGTVQLNVFPGDTIHFSAIGYFQTFEIIPLEIVVNKQINVFLKRHSYNLKTAEIKGIRTVEDLRKAIINMKTIDSNFDIPGLKQYRGPMTKPSPTVLTPISLIYNSKAAKKARAKKWNKTIIIPKMD